MSDSLNTIGLVIGLLLTLKKIADMERFYEARLLLITVVLSLFAIFFFLGYVLHVGDWRYNTCVPPFDTQY